MSINHYWFRDSCSRAHAKGEQTVGWFSKFANDLTGKILKVNPIDQLAAINV
jgi:hypothetical protein